MEGLSTPAQNNPVTEKKVEQQTVEEPFNEPPPQENTIPAVEVQKEPEPSNELLKEINQSAQVSSIRPVDLTVPVDPHPPQPESERQVHTTHPDVPSERVPTPHQQVPEHERVPTLPHQAAPSVTHVNPAGSSAHVGSPTIEEVKKEPIMNLTPRPKRTYTATPEVRRTIFLALGGLAFLFAFLMVFTEGLHNQIHLSLPLFIAGYAIFYQFFPHDWEKERYWMSHLHLGSTLLVGIFFISVFDLSKENLCSDGIWGRIVDINSMAYFIIDSLVLIDTLWITHHSLSIGCSIFGIAGTRQVVGGSIYVWYAEIGGLLYHISRIWADSKKVRQIFLVSYLASRLVMLWIATISFRCTYDQFNRAGIGADFFVDATLTCFTTGVALVNLRFLYINYLNYLRKFGSKKKAE